MSFRITDRETGEITETDEPLAFWMSVRERADADNEAWCTNRLEALAQRSFIAQSKDDLEYCEAMLRQSEGVITGKNAEERKAAFEQLIHEDPYWKTLTERVRAGEQRIGELEAEAEAAHNRYRIGLRDLDVMAALYGPQHER